MNLHSSRTSVVLLFAMFASASVICGASKHPFGVLVNNRFQIEHFAKNGPQVYAACEYWNQSDDPHRLRPAAVIRGIQSRDGRFLPYVKLAAGRTENGPWMSIEPKMPQGKKMQLVVPVTIRVVPLNVDCAPFLSQSGKMKWARIVLPTGDEIVVDLKEIIDASNI